jgi:transketolase
VEKLRANISNMLNPKLHLNTKIFDKDVEQLPTRRGFGEGLLLAGSINKDVVALCSDLTESTQMHLFKEKFENRFIEVGIAEQNMAVVASGMAAMGKIPFMSSYAMFSPGRNWEQIRTSIAYNNQKVIIVGSHAGISVGPDGGTHQALEDIALMRVVPNMTVIYPCDSIEAKKATLACIDHPTPVYIRLAREKSPIVTTDDTPFHIGKAQLLFIPDAGLAQVGIVACGPLVSRALLAAKELEKKGVRVKVLNLTTIKPLDSDAVLQLAQESKAIVTVEEHQIAGGMGSAVAEYLAKVYPVHMEFVGVDDTFGQSGTQDELIAHYNMDTVNIIKACEKVMDRKNKMYK